MSSPSPDVAPTAQSATDIDPYDSALIGNCQSAALISRAGGLVWMCLPRLDSPAVFARILDPDGGELAIEALDTAVVSQRYLHLTNILETCFSGPGGTWKILDWMPRYFVGERAFCPPVVYRKLLLESGQPRLRIRCTPRPGFATSPVQVTQLGSSLLYEGAGNRFYLQSSLPLAYLAEGRPLRLRRTGYLVFSYGRPVDMLTEEEVRSSFERTRAYWERWSRSCYLPRNFQGAILRSALCLKLLTYEDTGGIVAAPTTSLPEDRGGPRNWDYRYCWLRDSYFIVRALARLAHFEEQNAYLDYLQQLDFDAAPIQPLFAIDGEKELTERELPHLRGAFGSAPVRVGNQACEHIQNDVYGELLLTLGPTWFDTRWWREEERPGLWDRIRRLAEMVVGIWREPDAGIWEYRDLPDHYVFSKVMCWAALRQAARIADDVGEQALADAWEAEAAIIRAEVLEKGYDPEINAFVGAYGGKTLDAANLVMVDVGFLPPDDPRYRGTVAAVEARLVVEGLCYRYRSVDDFGAPSATFSICTLWFIEALYWIGEKERARALFARFLSRANHVGLFSEGIHPGTGAMTGNFPQGYTHVAIINTGMLLSRSWGDERATGETP